MTKHQQTIADTRGSADRAELFLLKYESKLPEGLGYLYIVHEQVQFEISLEHRSQADRDKALTYLGETFGRSDWQAKINFDHTAFNWSKPVDGVSITIRCAQPTGQPKSFPVDPKQLPLQLKDQQ